MREPLFQIATRVPRGGGGQLAAAQDVLSPCVQMAVHGQGLESCTDAWEASTPEIPESTSLLLTQ